jgi:organic radical activating enzyme
MIPIQIIPNDPTTLKIVWTLTTACTYACDYCPAALHDGTNRKIDLKGFTTFLDMFKDRNRIIWISGGEPTIHPQFLEIISLLKSLNIKVVVDSNLSRSLDFYQRVAPLVDNWCVTLHPSQHEFNLNKIKVLSESSFTVVYVMMDPKYWSIATDWYNQVSNVKNLILKRLKPLNNWASSGYTGDFTQNQLLVLENSQPVNTFTEERTKELTREYTWLFNLSSTVKWEDQSISLLDGDALMIKGLNSFNGWKCSAVNEVISIDSAGMVNLATCGIRSLTHWNNIKPTDLIDSVICDRAFCDCATDVKASKIKI